MNGTRVRSGTGRHAPLTRTEIRAASHAAHDDHILEECTPLRSMQLTSSVLHSN